MDSQHVDLTENGKSICCDFLCKSLKVGVKVGKMCLILWKTADIMEENRTFVGENVSVGENKEKRDERGNSEVYCVFGDREGGI